MWLDSDPGTHPPEGAKPGTAHWMVRGDELKPALLMSLGGGYPPMWLVADVGVCGPQRMLADGWRYHSAIEPPEVTHG